MTKLFTVIYLSFCWIKEKILIFAISSFLSVSFRLYFPQFCCHLEILHVYLSFNVWMCLWMVSGWGSVYVCQFIYFHYHFYIRHVFTYFLYSLDFFGGYNLRLTRTDRLCGLPRVSYRFSYTVFLGLFLLFIYLSTIFHVSHLSFVLSINISGFGFKWALQFVIFLSWC